MAVASAVPFPPCPGPPQDWTVGCPYFAGLVLSCVQASVGERQRANALSYSRKDEDCASPKLAGNKRQPVTYPTQFFFFLTSETGQKTCCDSDLGGVQGLGPTAASPHFF